MEKGDIIIGPTPQELLDSGMVCHKIDDDNTIICKPDIPSLSHKDWDKVTCQECYFIAGLAYEKEKE
jgi:hypothetical protein